MTGARAAVWIGAAVSLCATLGAQPDHAERPAIAPFELVLWLNAGHAKTASALDAVRELGFTAVTVSADDDPGLPGRHRLGFYRDQVAGKGVLELREAEWSERRDAYEASRDPADLVRPHCLSDPATLLALRAEVERRLSPALAHRPLACSLGDEVAMTRHANPLDFCTSPHCLEGFREFLRQRHGDLVELNRAWNAKFATWDDVVPFTADRIRAREVDGLTLPANLRPWAEHREFCDRVFARAVAATGQAVDELAPDLPRGLTGMQPASAYGGHDYRRLMPGASFYEAYDLGGARDLAMSFADAGAWQVTTLFRPDPEQPMSYVRARLFDAIAHGMRGAVVWCSRDVFGEQGRPTPYASELSRASRALAPALRAAAGAEVERSSVWIVESQASVRAHWMLDSMGDGRTWIRRLSSYEREHSTSLAARHGWLRLFEDLGVQPRFVADRDLPQRLRASPPRLVVLPVQVAMSDTVAAAIETYVRGGGTVVADHALGCYDEHLVRRSSGALDRLFGITGRTEQLSAWTVGEGRAGAGGRLPTGAAAAERGVRGPEAERLGEFWVQAEHTVDRGRAVYLNLAVCEYGAVRLDPQRVRAARDLRSRVRRVLQSAGVEPVVQVRGEGLPTCIERLRLRAVDGRELLAIRLNALESPALMKLLSQRGARTVHLSFAEPVTLRDLVTERDLGRGTEFEAELDPWTGLLFAVERGG